MNNPSPMMNFQIPISKGEVKWEREKLPKKQKKQMKKKMQKKGLGNDAYVPVAIPKEEEKIATQMDWDYAWEEWKIVVLSYFGKE